MHWIALQCIATIRQEVPTFSIRLVSMGNTMHEVTKPNFVTHFSINFSTPASHITI